MLFQPPKSAKTTIAPKAVKEVPAHLRTPSPTVQRKFAALSFLSPDAEPDEMENEEPEVFDDTDREVEYAGPSALEYGMMFSPVPNYMMAEPLHSQRNQSNSTLSYRTSPMYPRSLPVCFDLDFIGALRKRM
jgi:hypothetical protein